MHQRQPQKKKKPYKTKQNKNKEIARHRDRNRETEPGLTHLFKNGSFDISLYREFLYTSHAGFFFMWGFFSYTSWPGFFFFNLFFLSREFLSHIPCWLHFYLGSFSYTSRAGFIFIWGVSLTHPVLASFFCGEFLLHISCWSLSLSLKLHTHNKFADLICMSFDNVHQHMDPNKALTVWYKLFMNEVSRHVPIPYKQV